MLFFYVFLFFGFPGASLGDCFSSYAQQTSDVALKQACDILR